MDHPPTSATAPTTSAQSRQRIDDEHRRLGRLLALLSDTCDPERIEALLAELRDLLVSHFETEEAPDGLHQIVGEGAAHRLPNLQHLFDEHREVLVRVDDLRAEARACLEGPVRQLCAGVGGLAETLRRHEADEEALFAEAFYTDIGGRA